MQQFFDSYLAARVECPVVFCFIFFGLTRWSSTGSLCVIDSAKNPVVQTHCSICTPLLGWLGDHHVGRLGSECSLQGTLVKGKCNARPQTCHWRTTQELFYLYVVTCPPPWQLFVSHYRTRGRSSPFGFCILFNIRAPTYMNTYNLVSV